MLTLSRKPTVRDCEFDTQGEWMSAEKWCTRNMKYCTVFGKETHILLSLVQPRPHEMNNQGGVNWNQGCIDYPHFQVGSSFYSSRIIIIWSPLDDKLPF